MVNAQSASGENSSPGKNGTRSNNKKFFRKALIPLVLVAAIAFFFFFFYVGPQSQYERDRIFRSMNHVSRLIDDRTMAADQALQSWEGDKEPGEQDRRKEIEKDFGTAGFKFGCGHPSVICISHGSFEAARNAGATSEKLKEIDRKNRVSIALKAIAQSAELPYPEAILLITDNQGHVLAGHDQEGKWAQFQSLETLMDVAAQPRPVNDKTDATDDMFGSETDQTSRLLRSAQRLGRGAQNLVFEGYPARLSRDVGGQTYAVYVASHQLGRSFNNDTLDTVIPTVNTNPDDLMELGPKSAETSGSRPLDQRKDELFFAYLIPERVIDGGAFHIPFQWTVNILVILVALFLSIPFLKLFNQSSLKPIRIVDLVAVLISIMLIIVTATLSLSAIMLRNSVARDIDGEMLRLSDAVEGSIIKSLDDPKMIDGDKPWTWQQAPRLTDLKFPKGAGWENAFIIGATGTCKDEVNLGCGDGLWYKQPIISNINVSDRAYFRAWRDRITMGTRSYVQFLRSKSNGKLSWAHILDLPIAAEQATQEVTKTKTPNAVPTTSKRRGVLISEMPLALMSPILPRNFSFAIVLNTDLPDALKAPGSARLGDVQYHSAQKNSLMENIIDEARNDPHLRAAIRVLRDRPSTASSRSTAASQSDRIDITYHSANHFARVSPITDTPWSLVILYDRTEALALFAETIAHAFFLSCFWVMICVGVSWLTPRGLRLLSGSFTSEGPHHLRLRSRSIWFFPNGLFDVTPGGVSYFFRMRVDEAVLSIFTVSVQATSFIALPPEKAVFFICGMSLIALVSHYLLIVEPERKLFPTSVRRTAIGAAAVLFASVIYAVASSKPWWFVIGTTLAIVGFILINLRQLGSVAARSEKVEERPAQSDVQEAGQATTKSTESIRRAYLNRALILLLIVILIPSIAFLNMFYTDYLKGYIGASLITASEEIGQQRRVFAVDLKVPKIEVLSSNKKPAIPPASPPLPEDIVRELHLRDFNQRRPGWFLASGEGALNASVFRIIGCSKLSEGLCDTPEPPLHEGHWMGALFSTLEPLLPNLGRNNVEIQDSKTMLSVTDAPTPSILLNEPAQYDVLNNRLSAAIGGFVLRGGPIGPFPMHPDKQGIAIALIFVPLFFFSFYRLLRQTAAVLTGLYLEKMHASPDAEQRLEERIRQSPLAVWKDLPTDGLRVRLLALASGKTLNFRDRGDIQYLVENGYVSLVPFLHITHPGFADYLKHDLPREERTAILRLVEEEDDKWDHMRMPVLVALGLCCVFFAYSSPGAVQLVLSSFLALTALLPFVRDPIGRVTELHRTTS